MWAMSWARPTKVLNSGWMFERPGGGRLLIAGAARAGSWASTCRSSVAQGRTGIEAQLVGQQVARPLDRPADCRTAGRNGRARASAGPTAVRAARVRGPVPRARRRRPRGGRRRGRHRCDPRSRRGASPRAACDAPGRTRRTRSPRAQVPATAPGLRATSTAASALRPASRCSCPAAASSVNRSESICWRSIARTYPPSRPSSGTPSSTRRNLETCACNALAAPLGGASPHSRSAS